MASADRAFYTASRPEVTPGYRSKRDRINRALEEGGFTPIVAEGARLFRFCFAIEDGPLDEARRRLSAPGGRRG